MQCHAASHRSLPPRGLRDQSVHATCRMPRVHATHMHARRAPRQWPRAGSAAVRQRTATDRPAHTVGPLSPLVSHSHLCARWHLATMGATWPLTCPDLACMQHPEFRPIGVHDPLPPPTPLRLPPPLLSHCMGHLSHRARASAIVINPCAARTPSSLPGPPATSPSWGRYAS